MFVCVWDREKGGGSLPQENGRPCNKRERENIGIALEVCEFTLTQGISWKNKNTNSKQTWRVRGNTRKFFRTSRIQV